MVFAGEALPADLHELAARLGVAARVVEIVKPSDAVLEALYNRARALVFPSRFEGFGWPVIEAQACGCPVLCSDAGSLGEVAGEGAFVRAAADEEAFAEELAARRRGRSRPRALGGTRFPQRRALHGRCNARPLRAAYDELGTQNVELKYC